jgi:glutamine synthetase
MILPAAIRYQGEVAQAVTATKTAGADAGASAEVLKSLSGTIGEFQKGITGLEKASSHHAEGDAYAHAKNMRDHVLPAMLELRKAGDKLENIVADDLWPLPTYREMLFIR